jgi:DNA-binding response OmpR family regulator
MLTARANENDMLHGFSVGVDDFVKKPFNKNELEARVRALPRRANNNNGDAVSYIMSYEDSVLEIDLTTQTVKSIMRLWNLHLGNTVCWLVWYASRARSSPSVNWRGKCGGSLFQAT